MSVRVLGGRMCTGERVIECRGLCEETTCGTECAEECAGSECERVQDCVCGNVRNKV